jgi:CheY-like chemotaxis protein
MRMNILVIDSDRVAQRLVARLIERLGLPAPTQAIAPDQVPARNWSLVLVAADDGVQMLHDARRRYGAQPQLVAMLAQDSSALRRSCHDAGADAVLVKPLTREALAPFCAPVTTEPDDFNPAVWTELRTLFGADGVQRLRATLVDDLPVQQSRLAEAIHDRDLSALRHIAHALRGVSLQLGAGTLAERWMQVEQAAAAGDAHTVLELGAGLMARHAALVQRLSDDRVAL